MRKLHGCGIMGKNILQRRNTMTAWKIITASLGILFALFGYFIYFKGKYSLINGFDEDFRVGRKNESYAKRVGLAEFAAGIALLITAASLVLFA